MAMDMRRYENVLRKQTGKAVRPARFDGYVNLINRYGTAKDDTEQYFFKPEPIVDDVTLEMFYENNGLFARIIDTPAEEAVKHGFTIDGISDDEITDFYTAAIDELDWDEVAMTALKWARLFGGSIAVMLINDGHGLEEPVDWKHIRSIDDIVVFDRSMIMPDRTSLYQYDLEDPFRTRGSRLGTPEWYEITGPNGNFVVHDSRCLTFRNGVLPLNAQNENYQIWGIPEYVRINRAVRNAEIAHESAPKMLSKSVQPVYKMKDLAMELATEEGEDKVLRRLQAIDMARGLLNSITIDAEGEDYSFQSFGFTGVSDVIESSCNWLSALTNIPQTILFGRSPAGMNATGHSDFENYYNYVERIQKRMLRSNLRYLLSIIFTAGKHTGEIKEIPDINVQFNPLWSMNEEEETQLETVKLQNELTRANIAQTYIGMEVLDPKEVRVELGKDDPMDPETMLDEMSEEELLESAPQGQPGAEGEEGGMPGVGGEAEAAPAPAPAQDEAEAYYATNGNSPETAPEATKLPQDMNPEEEPDHEDAEGEDLDWITMNGTHIPLDENGTAVGGPVAGRTFSEAKSERKSTSKAANTASHVAALNRGVDEAFSKGSTTDRYEAMKTALRDAPVGSAFRLGHLDLVKVSQPTERGDKCYALGTSKTATRSESEVLGLMGTFGDDPYDPRPEFYDHDGKIREAEEKLEVLEKEGKVKGSAEVRDYEKKAEAEGKITKDSKRYGQPGTYVVYRAGAIEKGNGMSFFAPNKEGADTYSEVTGPARAVKRYEIDVKKPLVVNKNSDGEMVTEAWKVLHPGKRPPSNITPKQWMQMDKQNAKALASGESGFDAIIYLRNGTPQEFQIPSRRYASTGRTTGEFTTTDWSRLGHDALSAVYNGKFTEDYERVDSDDADRQDDETEELSSDPGGLIKRWSAPEYQPPYFDPEESGNWLVKDTDAIMSFVPDDDINSPEWLDDEIKRRIRSVGVLVVDQHGKILSGIRKGGTGENYGLLGGPGGHVELHESLEDAAIRETYEEFGIVAKDLMFLTLGDYEEESGMIPAIFLCTEWAGTVHPVDGEMENLRFRTIDDILSYKLFEPFKTSLEILENELTFEPEDGNIATVEEDERFDGASQGLVKAVIARAQAKGFKPVSGEDNFGKAVDYLKKQFITVDDIVSEWSKKDADRKENIKRQHESSEIKRTTPALNQDPTKGNIAVYPGHAKFLATAQDLKNAIASGTIKGAINIKDQSKHHKGSPDYNAAVAKGYHVSYLTISDDDLDRLVQAKRGTGRVYCINGQYTEFIYAGRRIGRYLDKNGKTERTMYIKVHYGAKGYHAVPAPPNIWK